MDHHGTVIKAVKSDPEGGPGGAFNYLCGREARSKIHVGKVFV